MTLRATAQIERSRLLLDGYSPPEVPERDATLSDKHGRMRSRGFRFVTSILNSRDRRRAAHRFERDYPAMLLALASSIRTGLDPLAAMLDLADQFSKDSEISNELARLKSAIETGLDEEQAIRSFGSGIDSPDIRLFTTAFVLSRREGSSLAECLQRLARVTRQRQSFRRKIRSAVAMQKLSCLGIGVSAVALGAIQSLSNMKALTLALSDPVGSRLLGAGGALILTGIFWMSRMATPRV